MLLFFQKIRIKQNKIEIKLKKLLYPNCIQILLRFFENLTLMYISDLIFDTISVCITTTTKNTAD